MTAPPITKAGYLSKPLLRRKLWTYVVIYFIQYPCVMRLRTPVDIMRIHPWRMANIELVDGGTLAFYDYNDA